jgi:uncharacterized phage protein gp47/JayE
LFTFTSALTGILIYQTTAQTTIGLTATTIPLAAVSAGAITNLDPGTPLRLQGTIPGFNGFATTVSLIGGTDEETDDALRARVLERIQNRRWVVIARRVRWGSVFQDVPVHG